MLKNKMTMSIVAFTASIFLFVVATFAWLTLSNLVDANITEIDFNNVEATAILELSEDAWQTSSPTSAISFANSVPGDTFYYRLIIENTGAVDIFSAVLFKGFTNDAASALGDQTNFANGQTLIDILEIGVSINTFDSETITYTLLSDLIGELMPGDTYATVMCTLASNLSIPVGDSDTVYITIRIAESAGNDYQNLKLLIDSIQIQSVSE